MSKTSTFFFLNCRTPQWHVYVFNKIILYATNIFVFFSKTPLLFNAKPNKKYFCLKSLFFSIFNKINLN